MFDVCSEVENLYFFDSDDVVRYSGLSDVIARREKYGKYGNGVHVTNEARSFITDRLVNGVLYLQTLRSGARENFRLHGYWPLRPSFIRQLQTKRNWPG